MKIIKMQNSEISCKESERVIKKLKTDRSAIPSLVSFESTSKPEASQQEYCLFSQLLELHYGEYSKTPEDIRNGLKYNSFLLEKLVMRERLNTLILNLYPENEGFSMGFRKIPPTETGSENAANIVETVKWLYEDDDILRYIDNEELPPTLVDIIEKHYGHLFYNGCVIAEVRDYRQAFPQTNCDIHHVLLRPTLKSIIADINNMMETCNSVSMVEELEVWSKEERHMLESQILLANNPVVCLDPDTNISSFQLRLNHNRNMWNTHKFHRMARKFSQVTVNRKRKLNQFTHKSGIELFDYINRVKTKNLVTPRVMKPIPVPILDTPPIAAPSEGVVINEFKAYQPTVESTDYLPQLVEEYVLETMTATRDKAKPRVYHIRLSILQRPSNSEYLGEYYLDRDHKENEWNGVACRFTLGSITQVNKYIEQFRETFTKSGRQNVKISQGRIPGSRLSGSINHSQGMNQNNSQSGNVVQQQQSQSCTKQGQQQMLISNNSVNGAISGGISFAHNQQSTSTGNNTPVLQSHLQAPSMNKTAGTQNMSNQDLKIKAIAMELMDIGQQFQAAAKAKQEEQQRQLQQQQQQQQQQKAAKMNNTIINLLNRLPMNSEANTAVVNAINSTSFLPQQMSATTNTQQQKLLTTRKMTLMNLSAVNASTRISNNTGNLVVSSQQPQTITLTSLNSNERLNFATGSVKQQLVGQRMTPLKESNAPSALTTLLVGTPAADRPDIVGSNNDSLLLEKLASSSSSNSLQAAAHTFLQNPKSQQQQQQFLLQSSSKMNTTVKSPLSSPPTQNVAAAAAANTISVQSLKLSQIQSLTGLQNVQVQFHGFPQHISVPLNGNLQGQTGLLVSVPVTSSSSPSSNTSTQSANSGSAVVNTTGGGGGPTVILANASSTSLAQLVSGMKNLNHQTIRQTAVPNAAAGAATTVSLAQGQQFQLITPLQGQRLEQLNLQQNITTRTIQRQPITIQMAPPISSNSANSSQVTIDKNTLNQQQQQQLQKQVQFQQLHQQLCLTQQQQQQQQNININLRQARRRSNTSTEPQ